MTTTTAAGGRTAQELAELLKLALPYVERVAATAPTEYGRQVRQRQACRDADAIRAALAKAGGAA